MKLKLVLFVSSNTHRVQGLILKKIQGWFFARKIVREVEKRRPEIKKVLLNKELILSLKV